MILRLVLIAAAIYFILVIFLYISQRKHLYHPDQNIPKPSDWEVPDMHAVALVTEDGLNLLSWYKEAKKHKATIVYFHGNAGHLGMRAARMRSFLQEGYGLLLVSYRGYAGNPGVPSEKGLYSDARSAVSFLLHKGISKSCMVLFGESLGTGVATQLAYENPDVGALILQSPYTSMVEAASAHYPFVPINWLLKDRFDSINKIAKINTPLIIYHGKKDKLVPVSMAKKMYERAPGKKLIDIADDKEHNDVFTEDIAQKIIIFLQQNVICNKDI